MIGGGEVIEDASEILLFSGIDLVLLELLLNGFLLLRLALLDFLDVEVVLFGLVHLILLLKQDGVLILLLQMWRQIMQFDLFFRLLSFHCYNYKKPIEEINLLDVIFLILNSNWRI